MNLQREEDLTPPFPSPGLPAAAAVRAALNPFYPMNEFYEDAGLALPEVVPVEGQDVPEPYRSLLVHDRDMTPTLASAYRRAMQLRVFKRVVRENILARQIILEIEGNGKPVVFAAIKIHLDRFPSEARRLILEGKQAFGNILHGQQIVHFSQPEAFFRVVTDDTINQALGLTGHSVLYGRRTAMWHSSDIALAQVLEILPPSA